MYKNFLRALFSVVFILGIIVLSVLAGNYGDRIRKPMVVENAIEELEEAWFQSDIEALNCDKEPSDFYRYKEIVAVHAAMCAQLAEVKSELGSPWISPMFIIIESHE